MVSFGPHLSTELQNVSSPPPPWRQGTVLQRHVEGVGINMPNLALGTMQSGMSHCVD